VDGLESDTEFRRFAFYGFISNVDLPVIIIKRKSFCRSIIMQLPCLIDIEQGTYLQCPYKTYAQIDRYAISSPSWQCLGKRMKNISNYGSAVFLWRLVKRSMVH
jgi:hypothetical protein